MGQSMKVLLMKVPIFFNDLLWSLQEKGKASLKDVENFLNATCLTIKGLMFLVQGQKGTIDCDQRPILGSDLYFF